MGSMNFWQLLSCLDGGQIILCKCLFILSFKTSNYSIHSVEFVKKVDAILYGGDRLKFTESIHEQACSQSPEDFIK
jgi:hypothetical protein